MNKKILWFLVFVLFTLVTVKGALAAEIIATNFEDDLVSLVDTETDEKIDLKVDNGPNKIAVTGDNRLAIVTNTLADTVSIISLEKKTVLDDIEVGKDPIGITITPDNKYAIIANSKSNSISILDLATLEVKKQLGVGDQPIGIAVSNNNKAYVTSLGDNAITVIDLANLEVITSFSDPALLRSPGEIKITPNGKYAYIFDTRSDYLVTADLEQNKILDKNIKTQNTNINNELILGNQFAIFTANKDGTGVVQIIDFDDNYATILTEIEGSVSGIDFFDGILFVANSEGTVEEINTKTNKRNTITLGGKITDIEIIGKTKEAYKEPRKFPVSKDTKKIIVIIVIILIILILIFRNKPQEKQEIKDKPNMKKSQKAKKKIKKKIAKRKKVKKKARTKKKGRK
ncbi:MAG: YncE family protein [Nanoarchaeota archaeon]|nr:YncE family protein [Nanoarchaeota archaeon]